MGYAFTVVIVPVIAYGVGRIRSKYAANFLMGITLFTIVLPFKAISLIIQLS